MNAQRLSSYTNSSTKSSQTNASNVVSLPLTSCVYKKRPVNSSMRSCIIFFFFCFMQPGPTKLLRVALDDLPEQELGQHQDC
jgi:hypothetical protein